MPRAGAGPRWRHPLGDGGRARPAAPVRRRPRVAGFRCGSIRVPFERTDPSYGNTRIAFAVRTRDRADRPRWARSSPRRAARATPAPGPRTRTSHLFKGLLRRRDLVVVDMRGTGRSERIDCPDLQHGLGPASITVSECARQLGKRFVSYRTSAGADDLNAVRKALGLNRITLYGDSYGTYFGQSYAYRHGETLRALVLDSAYPAKGESPWYGSLIRTGIRSLRLACRRSPDCSGDIVGRLDTLARFLRAHGPHGRAADPRPRPLHLRHARFLSRPRSRRHGAAARAREAVASRDPALPAGRQRRADRVRARPRAGGELQRLPDDLGEAARPSRSGDASSSARSAATRTTSARSGRARSRSRSTRATSTASPGRAPTRVYEPPISAGDEPTKAPVLVVSGEMDNLTTPQEGRWTAELFPRSRLFVARNAGHVDSLIHHDGAAAQDDPALPARGTERGLGLGGDRRRPAASGRRSRAPRPR